MRRPRRSSWVSADDLRGDFAMAASENLYVLVIEPFARCRRLHNGNTEGFRCRSPAQMRFFNKAT